LLGRIRAHAGELAKAREEYAKVLASWTDPQAGVREITADAPDDPRSMRRLGRALTALGEAFYFEAEQKRAAALRVTAPAYRGVATETAVAQHFSKEVARYLRKRRALVEEAEAAYRSIVEIQPLPPPRWVVAAAERVAGLHEATAAELAALPLPPTLAKSAEAKAAYESTLREVAAPIRERAKLAYRACVGLAAKFRVEDEHSKRCEARLAVIDPARP
jgi:hypothetical protein